MLNGEKMKLDNSISILYVCLVFKQEGVETGPWDSTVFGLYCKTMHRMGCPGLYYTIWDEIK